MSTEGLTYPAQASSLRKGGYIVINDHPCRVVGMTISKTGKHGHGKVHFTALDIFTSKKIEMLESSTHNVSVPHVSKTEFTLVDIEENRLSLMNESGELKEDLNLPSGELGEQIQAGFDDGKELIIIVQASMNIEAVISFKLSVNN